MKNRETQILIEVHERTIVRPLPDTVRTFCGECCEETTFLIPERAAAQTGLKVREIYRRIERGALHFCESEDGSALICRNSLYPNDDNQAPALPVRLLDEPCAEGEK